MEDHRDQQEVPRMWQVQCKHVLIPEDCFSCYIWYTCRSYFSLCVAGKHVLIVRVSTSCVLAYIWYTYRSYFSLCVAGKRVHVGKGFN